MDEIFHSKWFIASGCLLTNLLYLLQSRTIFCRILSNSAKKYVDLCSKLVVGKNVSWLQFTHYHSCKMTEISAKFH